LYISNLIQEQELARENGSKLKEAAIFTRVDVRAQGCGKPWSHGVIPAVLLAVVPGPTEMFYMTLCADNNFRLVPAGAIDHVYLEEEATVDTTFKKITGDVLQSPSIPPKEKWNVMVSFSPLAFLFMFLTYKLVGFVNQSITSSSKVCSARPR
jgi:hypothetical protein